MKIDKSLISGSTTMLILYLPGGQEGGVGRVYGAGECRDPRRIPGVRRGHAG